MADGAPGYRPPVGHGLIAAGPGLDWADGYAILLVVVGISFAAAIGALSHQHERAFSASMIYLLLGIAMAVVIELVGIDWLSPTGDAQLIERLSELAVVFALFATGLKLDRPLGLRRWGSVVRLLAIAMPLTIAAIVGLGMTLMGLPLAAAVLLAAALAPTDPVLAGDLGVGPPGEEDEREPNFAITAEAGLNDGLAFPFVILALFLAGRPGVAWLPEWFLADLVYAVAAGIAIGAVGGWVLAAIVVPMRARGLLRRELDGWLPIACVLVVYGAAEVASAYGFLAAFAGGLAFRRFQRDSTVHDGVHAGAETAEKFGELAVLLVLGSLVTTSGLAEPGIGGWLLVLAILFVVRPVSVLVALAGSRLPRGDRTFLAWFGVRGLGSLYYVAAALSYGVLPRQQELEIFWTVAVAIILSVVLHGATGSHGARLLIGTRRRE